MYRTDYHTHTPLCRHAEGSPEDFVARALELGLHEYGISDHAPMPGDAFDDWRMRESDLPAYLKWIDAARTAARGTGLIIRAGLECDWLPGIEKWSAHLRSLYDWDYLIGSVHYLAPGWAFDDPALAGLFHTGTSEEDWRLYWRHYEAMASSGLFDIYGHIDLIRKWGRVPDEDWISLAEPALAAMKRGGGIMEINTAGLHTAAKTHYPHPALLARARQFGIPIQINSDAHAPETLSRDFETAARSAIRAGYTHTTLPDHSRRPLNDSLPETDA